MLNRAYSIFEVKAIDEGSRTIEGIASTPSTDRVGDIVESLGADYALPIPFLWQHNSREPIGHVTAAKVTKEGILVTCVVAKIDEAGKLKDRLDEAWQMLKAKLVRGLSIGFQPLESVRIEGTYSYRFVKWLWLELSAVTIPANQDATITAIKSIDRPLLLAASGIQQKSGGIVLTPPGVSGSPSTPPIRTPKEGTTMKTISEQIAALEAKRGANVAQMDTVLRKGLDEGRTTTTEEGNEVDELEATNAAIEKDIARLKRLEKAQAGTAAPVRTVETEAQRTGNGSASLAPSGIQVSSPKQEKGIQFARYARCVGLAHKLKRDVQSVADELYKDRDPEVVAMIKAAGSAVSALTTSNSAALVGNEGGFADFVDFLRSQTIIGRFGQNGVPSLRGIPFRVPLISQSTGGSAWWVGEGDGKPLTRPTFARTELAPLKVATIAVATMETLRDSSPAAERLIRDDLAAAVREREDLSFVDPANNGSANVSPASITYGAETVASTGDDEDDIILDVRALMAKFIEAKNPLNSGVWIMSSSAALALSMVRNPLGQAAFPGITMNGGIFQGLPVITSEYVTDYVVLVNAQDIWLGDEGGINVDMSSEASLQMVDGTDEGATNNSATPVATSLVSMFQTNSVAFRAERTINWARRRTSAVAYLTGVSWGGAVPAS